jgi:hypothetical protein
MVPMIWSAVQRRTIAVQLSSSLLRASQIQGENIHPIPVAAASKAWVGVRSIFGNAASNPADWMTVSVVNVVCVWSGRGVCDGPNPRSQRSYRVRVCLCHRVWASATIPSAPTVSRYKRRQRKKNIFTETAIYHYPATALNVQRQFFEVWHPRCIGQNHKIKSRC